MNPDVTEFIEGIQEPWKKELCSQLRGIVYEAIPDLQERIQYKKPHF